MIENGRANLMVDSAALDEMTQLEDNIRTRLRGYVCDFRITVRAGGVWLSGRSRSFYAKQLAQHNVMTLVDLPIKANEIQVE